LREIPQTDALPQILLDWYDVHARAMPWRVGPEARKAGVQPDPYRIWMSEIMLQQTTVATVRSYFERFTARWPTVRDLAAAQDADVMGEWAGLGYYARARNLLKGARAVVTDHGGTFPDTYEVLLTLPGVGPYTAAAVSAIAFDQQSTVLDGNVERVMVGRKCSTRANRQLPVNGVVIKFVMFLLKGHANVVPLASNVIGYAYPPCSRGGTIPFKEAVTLIT